MTLKEQIQKAVDTDDWDSVILLASEAKKLIITEPQYRRGICESCNRHTVLSKDKIKSEWICEKCFNERDDESLRNNPEQSSLYPKYKYGICEDCGNYLMLHQDRISDDVWICEECLNYRYY